MINQLIITLCLVTFSANALATASSIDGRWQRSNKVCSLEKVEKVGRVVKVESCRIRFTIDGNHCRSANVTYRTSIGQVIKSANCYIDPDTKQMEVEVEADNGEFHNEVDVYLESLVDRYDGDVLSSKSIDDRTIFFYSK